MIQPDSVVEHEVEHQLQLPQDHRPSIRYHRHHYSLSTISLFATKPSPISSFTCRAILFLSSRPPFVSNHRAKTATSPRPANLPAHDILSRARGAAKRHQICKIHPELLEYRSNRYQKLSFNNHLSDRARAGSKSLSASKRSYSTDLG